MDWVTLCCAIVFGVGAYRKGADLVIAYVPLFTVSPNTDIKRTEENNHPTPYRYGDRAAARLPSFIIYDAAKGAFLRVLFNVILKFGDFRTKNYSSNAYLQAPDFFPKPLANIAIFCENALLSAVIFFIIRRFFACVGTSAGQA